MAATVSRQLSASRWQRPLRCQWKFILESHYRYIRAQGLLTALIDSQGHETDINYPGLAAVYHGGSTPPNFSGVFGEPSSIQLPYTGSDPTQRKQLVFHSGFSYGPTLSMEALDETGTQVAENTSQPRGTKRSARQRGARQSRADPAQYPALP